VYNWLADYFNNHTQRTRYGGVLSTPQSITASVIQGSAIGPASFLVCAADLHPINDNNHINKYADDCYLLIPASNTHLCQQELANVEAWAAKNHLKLNTAKTVEMIIEAGHSSKTQHFLPLPQPNITREVSISMLGVTIQKDLKMSSHVASKIEACSKALFALKTLKAHGMPAQELHEVFRATTLASLLYAAPAWWGFASSADQDRLSSFLKKAIKFGFYPPNALTINGIVDRDEKSLFKSIINNPTHTLYSLLPPKKQHSHNLRSRAHPFCIPSSVSALHDKNYMTRMLRSNTY
jgi:hypothetical protein